MKIRRYVEAIAVSALLAGTAQAINWDNGGADNKWSTAANWADDNIPDNNTETAAFIGAANVAIDVDQDFTIQSYTDGFGGEGFTNTLYGAGTLTIDRNANGQAGIFSATGNGGATLRLNGKVAINNSAGGNTLVQNANSAGNTTLFDTASTLTLNTVLQTAQGSGGSIRFNGTLASSSANLVIGSDNVSFGDGHLSSNFGADIVFNANAKLAIDGGTVLNTGRKFQVNGTGSELELNGANAINGANVVVAGANSFTLDVNSDQADFGYVKTGTGTLTIDLDAAVADLFFDDSSTQDWTGATVSIVGFREGVIRFGTDANGLTEDQLAVMDGGIYSLTDTGYLTIPEPATLGLFVISAATIFIGRRYAK